MVDIPFDFDHNGQQVKGRVSSVSGGGYGDIDGIPRVWHVEIWQNKPKPGLYHWGRLIYDRDKAYFTANYVANNTPTAEDLEVVDKINDIMREYFHLNG